MTKGRAKTSEVSNCDHRRGEKGTGDIGSKKKDVLKKKTGATFRKMHLPGTEALLDRQVDCGPTMKKVESLGDGKALNRE